MWMTSSPDISCQSEDALAVKREAKREEKLGEGKLSETLHLLRGGRNFSLWISRFPGNVPSSFWLR
jgi:hypothetical protein